MTRSVEDAAIVLSIIAGEDPNDKRTLSQPLPVPDYTKALTTTALPLQGKRIGIPRSSLPPTTPTSILSTFTQSIQTLENLGATIVDPANLPFAKDIFDCGDQILSVDFKIEIQQYLAGLKHIPSGIQSLADIIKFNIDHPDLELPEGYADQGRLIDSEATVGRDEAYMKALAHNLEMGAEKGIDFVLKEFKLDALVLPAKGTSSPAALAGYPIVTGMFQTCVLYVILMRFVLSSPRILPRRRTNHLRWGNRSSRISCTRNAIRDILFRCSIWWICINRDSLCVRARDQDEIES